MSTVGVAIPSIPPRRDMLKAAVLSVWKQHRPVDQLSVAIDNRRRGVSANRNDAWRALQTDYVAFLDDDDVFYENHIGFLLAMAEQANADVVYPWFDVKDRQVPPRWSRPEDQMKFLFVDGEDAEGRVFDDQARDCLRNRANFVPVTALVRRSMLERVGGFPECGTDRWPHKDNEDWCVWRDIIDLGGTFVHLPKRTWQWRWHFGHTMGRPEW